MRSIAPVVRSAVLMSERRGGGGGGGGWGGVRGLGRVSTFFGAVVERGGWVVGIGEL